MWFDLLPLELSTLTELVEPQVDVGTKETVISSGISEGLKKLYSLWQLTEKQAALAEVDLKFSGGSDEQRGKVYELKTKGRALAVLFGIALNDEFELWGKEEAIGIRKGWQIVEFKHELPPFLRMFGLGGDG